MSSGFCSYGEMREKLYRVQMNSKGMPNFNTAVEVANLPTIEVSEGEWVGEQTDIGMAN